MIIYTKNIAVIGKKKMSRSTSKINAAMITRYVTLIIKLLPFAYRDLILYAPYPTFAQVTTINQMASMALSCRKQDVPGQSIQTFPVSIGFKEIPASNRYTRVGQWKACADLKLNSSTLKRIEVMVTKSRQVAVMGFRFRDPLFDHLF
jgi:hypothetical protein